MNQPIKACECSVRKRPQKAFVAVGTLVNPAPPAQIRTGRITAYGSYLGYLASKRCFTHIEQVARRAGPALRPGRGRLPDVLLGRSPSLHALRRWPSTVVRALRRYYATVRLPTDVRVGLLAQGLLQLARHTFHDGRRWGLPVLARGVSIHAWGLRLRGVLRMLAIAHPSVLPSAMRNDVGTPVAIISQLNTQPACAPVNASPTALQLPTHDSGSGWLATPFLCDSFIYNSTPVYPGALRNLLGESRDLMPMQVVEILGHELVQAAVGIAAGHGREFRRVAKGIGLKGQMVATTAGPEFEKAMQPILQAAGPLPHGRLHLKIGGSSHSSRRKKQYSWQIKCACTNCGYIVHTTRKWLELAGTPLCPAHGRMEIEKTKSPTIV